MTTSWRVNHACPVDGCCCGSRPRRRRLLLNIPSSTSMSKCPRAQVLIGLVPKCSASRQVLLVVRKRF